MLRLVMWMTVQQLLSLRFSAPPERGICVWIGAFLSYYPLLLFFSPFSIKIRISFLIPLCCHGNDGNCAFVFWGILAACSQNSSTELMKAGTCPTSAAGITFSISSFLGGKDLCLAFLLTPFLEGNPKYLSHMWEPSLCWQLHSWPRSRGTLPFSMSGACHCYHLCVASLHPGEMPDMALVDFTYGARTIDYREPCWDHQANTYLWDGRNPAAREDRQQNYSCWEQGNA